MENSVTDRFVEIGHIGRPRGLHGVIRFVPNHHFSESLFDRTDLFYMKNNRSDLVPARIETVHVETKRNQQTFFVKFDVIASRDDAEWATDRALFAERKYLDDEPPDTGGHQDPDLYGYTVRYKEQVFGNVLDRIENPAHPILEVKRGSGTILIPMADEFVEDIDHEEKIVYCINLNQLTEL